MPIHYMPNDPRTLDFAPLRQQPARKKRPRGRADLSFSAEARQDLYAPGTPDFLHWQCREAALSAVDCWEEIAGRLDEWSPGMADRKTLALIPNAGQQLNAFYDRSSLSFFEHTSPLQVGQRGAPSHTTYTGASADVVSHEAGHAFLDTLRPDLWTSPMTETSAFHEAFGDCMAVLTALSDRDTRIKVLEISPDLGDPNFVEAVMEELGHGVALAYGAEHPAAGPRHCLNDFIWQLPTTLPNWGPPDQLISEVHSFGRVFAGCFYDTLRLIFAGMREPDADPSEETLWEATKVAGKLLVEGTQQATESPRFFRAVGQGMIKAAEALDPSPDGERYRMPVRDAFQRHGIALGSSAMTAPRAALDGSGPDLEEEGAAILSRRTRSDVARRIGGNPRRMRVSAVSVDGEPMAKVVHEREVSLSRLAAPLEGVVTYVPEALLVGEVRGRAAVRSAIPDAGTAEDEVRAFVATLLQHGQIDLGAPGPAAARGARGRRPGRQLRAVAGAPGPDFQTHRVESRGRKKVLVRTRFVCGPCP